MLQKKYITIRKLETSKLTVLSQLLQNYFSPAKICIYFVNDDLLRDASQSLEQYFKKLQQIVKLINAVVYKKKKTVK